MCVGRIWNMCQMPHFTDNINKNPTIYSDQGLLLKKKTQVYGHVHLPPTPPVLANYEMIHGREIPPESGNRERFAMSKPQSWNGASTKIPEESRTFLILLSFTGRCNIPYWTRVRLQESHSFLPLTQWLWLNKRKYVKVYFSDWSKEHVTQLSSLVVNYFPGSRWQLHCIFRLSFLVSVIH